MEKARIHTAYKQHKKSYSTTTTKKTPHTTPIKNKLKTQSKN